VFDKRLLQEEKNQKNILYQLKDLDKCFDDIELVKKAIVQ
jgi:hypothetical protein